MFFSNRQNQTRSLSPPSQHNPNSNKIDIQQSTEHLKNSQLLLSTIYLSPPRPSASIPDMSIFKAIHVQERASNSDTAVYSPRTIQNDLSESTNTRNESDEERSEACTLSLPRISSLGSARIDGDSSKHSNRDTCGFLPRLASPSTGHQLNVLQTSSDRVGLIQENPTCFEINMDHFVDPDQFFNESPAVSITSVNERQQIAVDEEIDMFAA